MKPGLNNNRTEGDMLKIGKLDNELLEKIVIDKIKYKRDEVLVRPGIGEDCAVLDYGEYECVVSTDPITAAIEKIGSLAVHISCNDIASNGIEPIGLLLTVLLPEGTTEKDIEDLMGQAAEAAEELKVEIIGGHTEITKAVEKPVIISTAVGRGAKKTSIIKMKPGDNIYVTKTVGLEGTGIIATDKKDEARKILTKEELAMAEKMTDMVSVVPEGVIAGKIGVSGMHDITEGGVLGAVWEMCRVSGTGALIKREDIPISKVTEKVCQSYGIDPLRLISSGSMLIIAPPEENSHKIEKAMQEAGIRLTLIGTVTDESEGLTLVSSDGEKSIIEPPESDEIYKV